MEETSLRHAPTLHHRRGATLACATSHSAPRLTMTSFLEIHHHEKWASVIYHPVIGIRPLAIMKLDSPAGMPSDDFRTLFCLFCPCPFTFFHPSSRDGTEGRIRISLVGRQRVRGGSRMGPGAFTPAHRRRWCTSAQLWPWPWWPRWSTRGARRGGGVAEARVVGEVQAGARRGC